MNNLGIAGLVVVAVLVVAGLVFWSRGRALGVGVAGGMMGHIDLKKGFPLTRGNGYSVRDVDEVLDRAYALATDSEGRAAALEQLHEAQFAVARGGYDSTVVDLHVDAMIVALQTGRELPVRPGAGTG
jgi:hypothetical protein